MRSTFFSVLCLIANFCVSCSSNPSPEVILQKALRYEQAGKYDKAIIEAKTVIADSAVRGEAANIISRSQSAQMERDIHDVWEMSDKELKKKGYFVSRCQFDN